MPSPSTIPELVLGGVFLLAFDRYTISLTAQMADSLASAPILVGIIALRAPFAVATRTQWYAGLVVVSALVLWALVYFNNRQRGSQMSYDVQPWEAWLLLLVFTLICGVSLML